MSQGYTIHVTGLSPETTTAKLTDFFSFCGKLLSVEKTEKEATLVFEKESAMRTSLMLNGGTLDGAHLEVTSATPSISSTAPSASLPAGATGSTPIGATGAHIEQEDKPKAGIVAEYLAHGYVLSDNIVQRAIEMDHKQGISSKFLNYIHSIDHKVGEKVIGPEATVSAKLNESIQPAVSKIKEVDQSRGISSRASDYYAKALNTSVGQKVLSFYTSTSKQVHDVHEEAKRIAVSKTGGAADQDGAEKKAAAGGTQPAAEATVGAGQEKVESALPTTTAGESTGSAPAVPSSEKAAVPAPAAPGPV
jgi:hypothetical protein